MVLVEGQWEPTVHGNITPSVGGLDSCEPGICFAGPGFCLPKYPSGVIREGSFGGSFGRLRSLLGGWGYYVRLLVGRLSLGRVAQVPLNRWSGLVGTGDLNHWCL